MVSFSYEKSALRLPWLRRVRLYRFSNLAEQPLIAAFRDKSIERDKMYIHVSEELASSGHKSIIGRRLTHSEDLRLATVSRRRNLLMLGYTIGCIAPSAHFDLRKKEATSPAPLSPYLRLPRLEKGGPSSSAVFGALLLDSVKNEFERKSRAGSASHGRWC